MSITRICNVHERRIAADPERVEDLSMTLSGPGDRLWPAEVPPCGSMGPWWSASAVVMDRSITS